MKCNILLSETYEFLTTHKYDIHSMMKSCTILFFWLKFIKCKCSYSMKIKNFELKDYSIGLKNIKTNLKLNSKHRKITTKRESSRKSVIKYI